MGALRSALVEVAKALAHEHRVQLSEQLLQGGRKRQIVANCPGHHCVLSFEAWPDGYVPLHGVAA